MSQQLPALTPKKVLRAFERAGFYVHHIKGSHYYLKHRGRPGVRITLPMHNTDLKRRTLLSIVEQSGFTIEEFLDLI
jgi:predicted RNA binding protein YcfA (HicA-like mRNA interferase family)